MDKHAVITGGTQGIGLALVQRFLAEGFTVSSCSRSIGKMPADVAQNPLLRLVAADLSKQEEVATFAAFVLAHSVPDVVVHNTGTYLPGSIQTEAPGVLETLLATNVHSAYHLTRALLPAMKAAGVGHIFTMCSVASIAAYVNGGSYCISKFALLGFTKTLRAELIGSPIRVTAVLPGAVLTPSWEGAGFPTERFIPSEDIASAVWATYQMAPSTVIEELLIRPLLGDIA
jgi:NAD(P)-dependent dehydrogenase (short-subunit alcohol dehydrogenase family)